MIMENNKATKITALAAKGTSLDLLLAEVRGEVKVTKLRARKPRKGETLTRAQGGGRPNPTPTQGANQGAIAVACNAGWVFSGQRGIGATATKNLSGVVKNAKRQAAEDRRADALDRAADREARIARNLTALISEIQEG